MWILGSFKWKLCCFFLTKGVKSNLITGDNIASDDKLIKEVFEEMKQEGIKFFKDKIMFASKFENGGKDNG